MSYLRAALYVTSALTVLAGAAPAFAGEASAEASAQPASASSNYDVSLEDDGRTIIVTAQKRAQTLIEVPQSISVVSGANLEQMQASTFSDYLKVVPGLQLNQSTPGAGRLVIRGVNTGGIASTVAVYVDETPFGSSSGLVNAAVLAGDFDTFDLDRIEVLRGPQGTVYGASSLSGVLKFVTNEPSTDALEVRGRVGAEAVDGGDTGYYGNVVLNVPLGETLAFRASGSYRKIPGFIDSIGTAGTNPDGTPSTAGNSDIAKNINDGESYGGRASLLFKPSEAVSIRLTAIAQDIKIDAPSIIESDPNTLAPLYGGLTQSQFVPQFTNVKYRVYNGTGTFDLGFGELTSSTSYSTQKQSARNDYTHAYSPYLEEAAGFPPHEFYQDQDTNLERFTQELRLAGESDALDWLVGAYYNKEDGVIVQDLLVGEPGTLAPIAGLPLLGHLNLDSKYEEIAGFANATIHISDQFHVDLGGRYSHNKQSAHQVGDGALAGGPSDFGVNRSKEDVFTYSVAPRFELNNNTSIYARVAKGFRPGGPNVLPADAPDDALRTYDSDATMNYEVGLKAETADGAFSIDVAAFHIDWKDIQLLATFGIYSFNDNGGKAKSDGVEFTAIARPTDGLALSINGAYTDARLTQDAPPLVGGLDGDSLPFTPKYAIGVNGNYHWALSDSVEARVGSSLRFLSDQSSDFDAEFIGRQRKVPSYEVIDLNAGVDFGRFSIDAYVKNLGNSHGLTSTTSVNVDGLPIYPNGAIGTGVIQPRTIGVSLTASY
jgi:outer membrane receptor protein involved in Fe transport